MAQLTPTEVLGAASELLVGNGFAIAPEITLVSGEILRVFEDSLSIVGLVQFDTWPALERHWVDAQVALVELLSDRLERNDPKAWEGYLLLFTLDRAPGALVIDAIRRDTTRLRKIVTTGAELEHLFQVERALLPVLPLLPESSGNGQQRVLDRLPALLATDGGPDPELTERVVKAFDENGLLMESIWAWRQEQ
jgi:hypothetical protein